MTIEIVKHITTGIVIAFGFLCGIGLILTVINFRKNIKLEKEVK